MKKRFTNGFIFHVICIAVIFAAGALLGKCSFAGTWVDLHIASKHSSDTYMTKTGEKAYNEVNPGIGIAYTVNNHVEAIAGIYDNSYNKWSVYGGADVHTSSDRIVRLGVSAGLITGYDSSIAVMPNIVVKASESVRVKVGIIPGIEDQASALALSIGIKF